MFDSRGEMRRYQELKTLELLGSISDLKLQQRFTIKVEGKKVCDYISDFMYQEDDKTIVEDFKGVRTAVFNLKWKLMKIIHPQYTYRISKK